jgi:uncharacterized Zn finger protein
MKETMQCPKCGKGNLIKAGHALEPGKGRVQQYRCKDCGRSTTKPLIQHRDDKGHFIPTPTTQSTPSITNTSVNQS